MGKLSAEGLDIMKLVSGINYQFINSLICVLIELLKSSNFIVCLGAQQMQLPEVNQKELQHYQNYHQ